MKYPLLLLFILPALTARANDAVKLNCPPRGAITVSFFDYYLITMKWGDHFQVASGKLQSHTKAGVPFWTTTFGNGDDLAYFPNTHQYYLFYAGSDGPVQCTEQQSYVYPVITPPRYESNMVSTKNSTPPIPDTEIDNSQVILRRPGAQG